MSAQSYEEERKRKDEGDSVCSYCSHCSSTATPLSAIPKAFFGKARTKNKVHKLPGERSDL
jgi:hypothetical protein